MVTAFVLINCSDEHEEKVVCNLKNAHGVKEVQRTIGSYDILAKVESGTHEELEIIKKKIRSLEKVRSTTALVGRAA